MAGPLIILYEISIIAVRFFAGKTLTGFEKGEKSGENENPSIEQ
jgi:Sec-independent protein secretion pathway component TatC